MTEEFLYYLWKNKLLIPDLFTTDNERIEIIHAGNQNYDSGPDFFNSKIKINETIWAGNIEMHINSSDWIKHNHSSDKAYDNVILHIVFNNDMAISSTTGEKIPTLEVKDKYDKLYYFKYKSLLQTKDWIPCATYIKNIDDFTVNIWLDRLLIERLERKSNEIEVKLDLLNNDWNELFYRVLAKNFGFKTNSSPFEILAKTLKFEILLKHSDSILQLEALMYGQAGLLNENIKDGYSEKLITEYKFLSAKYNLNPMIGDVWKMMRMRPVNFPTIRISQFAQLIHKTKHIFSKVVEIENLKQMRKLFDLNTSAYWENHYVFGKESKAKKKNLGENAFELILINTIVPVLFVYGNYMGNQQLKERALNFLSEVKAEKNAIISRWIKLGLKVENAAQSQALITLKESYCSKKRCLDCNIGHKLISRNAEKF
jgi:hypothetical protein